jgi:hypothetical protein
VNETSPATHADLTISLVKTPAWLGDPLPNGVEITVYLPVGATYLGVNGASSYTLTGATPNGATNSVKFVVYHPNPAGVISTGPVATVKCSMSTPLAEAAFHSANGGFPFGNPIEFQATSIYDTTTWDILGKYEPTISAVSLY